MVEQSNAVLWIDLRRRKTINAPPVELDFPTVRVELHAEIDLAIIRLSPMLLIFDFDFPDEDRLMILAETKRRWTSMPVFMLTEYHTEDLAIWALRANVLDYFIKPQDIVRATRKLNKYASFSAQKGVATCWLPELEPVPDSLRSLSQKPKLARLIASAVIYIEKNYQRKILEADLADLYGINVFHFSRSFKRECGITFREYLTQFRISQARNLLTYSKMPITQVASEVGFGDIACFSKHFLKIVGVTPSQYRKLNAEGGDEVRANLS